MSVSSPVIAVGVAGMMLRAFASVPITHAELASTALVVLAVYVRTVPLTSTAAYAGLIYVLSTAFRALFPVAQEPKACYVPNGPPPVVDRLVALVGELGLVVAVAKVLAPLGRYVGVGPRATAAVLVGIIVVAEVLCVMGCVSDPALHEREDDGWRLFACAVLIIAVATAARSRRPHERRLAMASAVAAGGFLWYMAGAWQAHNGAAHGKPFERDWSKCRRGALTEAEWQPVFRWQYLYFGAAALAVGGFVLAGSRRKRALEPRRE